MLERRLERDPGYQFEGGDGVAGCGLGVRQEPGHAFKLRHGDEGGLDVPRAGKKLEHGGGDDAERPLGADEQMLEIIARVVLAQAAQPIPQGAVGQHDLQPEHEVPGAAISEHRYPAGIGREIAADHATALRRQAQGKQAVDILCRRLKVGEHASRLRRHGVVERVDLADPVHARKAKHDAAAFLERHRSPDQAGIAPLGDNRNPGRRRQPHDFGDLLAVGRAHHGVAAAVISPPLIGEVRGHVLGVRDPALGADGRPDPAQHAGGGFGCGSHPYSPVKLRCR